MFQSAFRLLRRNVSKVLLASSLVGYNVLLKGVRGDEPKLQGIQIKDEKLAKIIKQQQMLKVIKEAELCNSKDIIEGEVYHFKVQAKRQDGSTYMHPVLIIRYKKKLYGLSGISPYVDPVEGKESGFEDAMVFGDKLLCPNHGSAFSITSGSVEYGPAKNNLPKFLVEQKNGKVIIHYPERMPKSILPKTQFRDYNDPRKVLIFGGDHHATMGCIEGLRQYGYGGEINLIMNGELDYPYQHDLLHRIIPNFKEKNKKITEKQIEKLLGEEVYEKLKFHPEQWFQRHGVSVTFNAENFRIINKRFYPYVSFVDKSKMQYDGILVATGSRPAAPLIENFTTVKDKIQPPANIFFPYKNKSQHVKLIKALNLQNIKTMLIFGLNPESLDFCQALMKSFPSIKIKFFDMNDQNVFFEKFGPDVSKELLKEYQKKGVEFYVKILQSPNVENKVALSEKAKINDSITVKLDEKTKVKGDVAALFPNNFKGNNKNIHKGKYTDIDFTKVTDLMIVDPNCRSDTKRIFGAGSCISLEYFFTRNSRMDSRNPTVAYEQGMTAAFNMLALNIPYHYIPFEVHNHFNKKLLFAGSHSRYDTTYIMGSVEDWDFVVFYADDDNIVGVSASPSRQKQFQVIRESFRLQCYPQLKELMEGQWSIPLIYKLIKKLDKSACYKDEIHELDQDANPKEVIWMDRDSVSFATKEDSRAENDSGIEIDRRGYVSEL